LSSLPQLRMRFTRFGDLEAPQPVPGYGLRTFREGDEDAWVGILSSGGFGLWDRARLDRMLADDQEVVPRGSRFFATRDDVPVGTACSRLYRSESGEVAELEWVAVLPEHQGHGLGLQVCRAVLGFIRDLGHNRAFLKTDDPRLPAICTYFRLGFEPEMTHESHPQRWEAVLAALSEGPRSDSGT
jgi:mycothiol synthase